MSEFDQGQFAEELDPDGPTPTGRTYIHSKCGGQTHVSGGDFTHICDPFRPCTGTFCCTCSNHFPLRDVRWADTGEKVSDFRRRVARATPGPLKAWRYGLGLLPGGAIGALAGWLVALWVKVAQQKVGQFVLIGGGIGAVLVYMIGVAILNRVFGIDYRRMR